MTFWKWSRTASANATADSTCPFPEGMAPSAVNDGVRGLMAAASKYRDDMSGALVTGGTASAYTLTSNQGFASPLADGTSICFWAHVTNAAGATFNLDGLGALPLMAPVNVQLQSGVIVAGTPYKVRYSNNTGWVLEGVFGGGFAIPIGAFMPYLSLTPPVSSFALPYGQAISRATYATLFSMIGTTFGVGDGSTTFNIPDLRGRTIVGQDNMGGAAAGLITTAGSGLDGTVLGAKGGSQNVTIAQNQLPNVTPTFTGAPSALSVQVPQGTASGRNDIAQAGFIPNNQFVPATVTPLGAVSSINGNVTQQATFNVQPSIVLPMLLRVI
jgi:microcystin-dependent protein